MPPKSHRLGLGFVAPALLIAMSMLSIGCDLFGRPSVVGQNIPDLQRSISNSDTVLVKFGATWCPPCEAMKPELESLRANPPAGVDVVEVDVDKQPEIAGQLNIGSIPHTMVLHKGRVMIDRIGFADEDELREMLAAVPR